MKGFIDRNGVLSRDHIRKLQVSSKKEDFTSQKSAIFLEKVTREIRSDSLREGKIQNVGETHFVINVDNGRTIDFCGIENVNYLDVAFSEKRVAMLVYLLGEVSSTV